MNRTFVFSCAVYWSVAMASAQVPIVVKAGKLLDVESGTMKIDQLILIEGEKIKAVGANLLIPAGAKIIELSRATVLPGLIDAHTHLLTQDKNRWYAEWTDPNRVFHVTKMNLADRALLGAAMAKETLEAGITTVRDLGNSGWNGDVALRDAINKGWVIGPRMFVSTRAISPIGGQFDRLTPQGRNIVEQEFAQITGAEEARRAVRYAVIEGADWIKVIAHHGDISLTIEEMKAIVDEAHSARRKVAVHAVGNRFVRQSLEAGVDSIEHGWVLSDDVLKIMAEKKVFLVSTGASWDMWLAVNGADSPWAAQTKAQLAGGDKVFRRALELGVPVAAGSDNVAQFKWSRGVASIMRMVRSTRDAGVSPIEIIRSATIHGAELLGWKDQIGSIKEGAFADLIAVPSDPLQDITILEHVAFVMKGGIVVKNDVSP